MKYSGEHTKEISFPLGGIGTGSIGLSGEGRLVDWEIFNKPSKGSINGYSHFAIKALGDDEPITYILNGDLLKDYSGKYRKEQHSGYGFGPHPFMMCGFPHFRQVEFDGEFPMASISFKDDKFPADVKMCAFNPFIPHDAYNSSIPAAFFEFEVHNTTGKNMKYQLVAAICNPFSVSENVVQNINGYSMITMKNAGVDSADVEYGDLTIATDCDNVQTQSYWYRGHKKRKDNIVSYWNEISRGDKFKERIYNTPGEYDMCTMVADVEVGPGECKKVRYILSWNVPNNYNYWNECKNEDGTHKGWKNYYATVFEDSRASAEYSLKNWKLLYDRTLLFKDTLYSSTLPEPLLEAAGANISILKSPTVFRLEDGSFYGWEGVHVDSGSCEGICQHVWNYAYAMCFLFPELERSIRDLEFKYSTDKNGKMGFRLQLPLGRGISPIRACLDGQMGAVIKCYREWKISGNDEWLSDNWENIKTVLEYAWSENNPDKWDRDKDGILEGMQHHTLDMVLYGPSSWLEGMYLLALKAASEMAAYLGDKQKEVEYRELFENGYKWTKENLFNGKYFIQKCDITDKTIVDRFDETDIYWNAETKQIKYQICNGSSIDQVLAQWHSDILGLGDIFDKEQVKVALESMMKNNYKKSMRDFVNPWRLFSLYDESGSVICDYPEGVLKPEIPVAYCEETMTGFEYSFAGILGSRNMLDDCIKVTKAVRDRFDGKKRNPWNEFECGSNYARAMSSYAFLPILSGFEFDIPRKSIGFKPYKTNNFNCIWSVGKAWGNFETDAKKVKFTVFENNIVLNTFGLKYCKDIKSLKIDGKSIGFKFINGVLSFNEMVVNHCLEAEIEL